MRYTELADSFPWRVELLPENVWDEVTTLMRDDRDDGPLGSGTSFAVTACATKPDHWTLWLSDASARYLAHPCARPSAFATTP
jgi:hypothetical protein